MTRALLKLFAVEHHSRLVYYTTSASDEPYFNIQAATKFPLCDIELKLPILPEAFR